MLFTPYIEHRMILPQNEPAIAASRKMKVEDSSGANLLPF